MLFTKYFLFIFTDLHWIGHKVCSNFSITPYGKTQVNLLANPIEAYTLCTYICKYREIDSRIPDII